MTEYFPGWLEQVPRWGTWRQDVARNGKPTKRPNGLVRNWSKTLEDLRRFPRSAEGGVGFSLSGWLVFDEDEDLYVFCLDVDGAVDPSTGHVAGWAQDLLEITDSFVEVSVSGTGLHVWFIARRPPVALSNGQRKLHEDECYGGKAPSLQLFGNGPGVRFVTCSLKPLENYQQPLRVVEWDDILRRFPQLVRATGEHAEIPLPARPQGFVPPSLEVVTSTVLQQRHGEAIIHADWQSILGTDERGRQRGSASDGYFVAVQSALRAAQYDYETACRWLLESTAWGDGEVEDSLDASRYADPEWVRADVARVYRKMLQRTTGGFDEIDTPPAEGDHHGPAGQRDAAPDDAAGAAEDGQDSLPFGALPEALTFRTGGDALRRSAATPYLIKHWLPLTGLAQIVGKPNAGKTPVAMAFGLAVASGREHIRGHRIAASARGKKVVFLVGEDVGGFEARLKAFAASWEIPVEVLDRNVEYSTAPADIGGAAFPKMIRRIAERGDVALVVVDTLAANADGSVDENDTKAMQAVVKQLQQLQAAIGGTGREGGEGGGEGGEGGGEGGGAGGEGGGVGGCVLTVHHTVKDRKGLELTGRGSSVLIGRLDVEIWVRKHPDGEDDLDILMGMGKARNWAKPRPMALRLEAVQVGTDEDGDPVSGITVSAGSASQGEGAFSCIIGSNHELLLGVLRDDGRSSFRHLHDRTRSVVPRRQLRTLLDDLIQVGHVREVRGRRAGDVSYEALTHCGPKLEEEQGGVETLGEEGPDFQSDASLLD